MPSIRTFDFAWPLGTSGEVRDISCALTRRTSDLWVLIRTSPALDEFESSDWCTITANFPESERRELSREGNHIVALKNYSENKDLLPRLESRGIIKHTGRRVPQGYVMLELVEILVPEQELIRACSRCQIYEKVDKARFAKCGKCKAKFYCSRECQAADWKAGHKKYCREGLSEEEVAEQVNAEVAGYLQESGFMTMKV
jgi:hypothetical protein